MLRRCDDKDDKDYGGRIDEAGEPDPVMVCEEWRTHFDYFLADMGPRPVGKSLERVDPKGHYNKENCVWATPKQQARNKRNSRLLNYQGQRMNLVDFAAMIGKTKAWVHWKLARWIEAGLKEDAAVAYVANEAQHQPKGIAV